MMNKLEIVNDVRNTCVDIQYAFNLNFNRSI